ncbi:MULTISPECIES: gephyrin-like molybdotransferase Glp [Moraxella]|uniref:Molybdopterin molybdenumtransferase n=1 Tax=Moraxella lacunata TaxID=477 RepID=A0A1B8Q6V7_MORLA|nr:MULTISPECIES: gephyrin-like molybdotransferase Glp [Moraxella]MBE9579904.1 molybdopterin molybdotransferase MoeA [Moraxella sp. K1664]MBE9588968.1 molybdopterin molybdotransferase MoeA [Moraxella sp. K1630]MBE9591399.1 molybdopterin molybdotransferase MoeA [Moraxella sp. K127]MBE9597208.1 molybdopterin molybdotransferase MoeA [Moraxella sp. K2450]MDH9220098.1 molybdopterin molybdotransferase MoeA [Moraxella lacunata]
MISVEDLQHAINATASTHAKAHKDTLALPLLSAIGHVLAQDITAGFDIPRQHLSAMDGFALGAGSDLASGSPFVVIGESCAGKPYQGMVDVGQAVRIFTGAVVPDGCDNVVMQENTDWDDIKHSIDKSTTYTITLAKDSYAGNNIRHQGEEVATGECVLSVGKRLNPADISLLANLGVADVVVYRPLVVGILATGDELVTVGESLPNLANIYNSNTPTLKALLKDLPIIIKDYGIIPDDLAKTCHAIEQAVHECDVVVSSAGVSVGDYDFLTHAIDKLGKITHYKVAMKPGKPFVFGELYDNADSPKTVLYFGLPGNPLSCVVGCLQFIIPALWRLSGVRDDDLPKRLTLKATLSHDIKKRAGRKEFMRGIYHQDELGGFVVQAVGVQDSHRIKQLSLANCLIVADKDSEGYLAGDEITIESFGWGFY